MTLLDLLVKSERTSLVNAGGIFRRFMACCRMCVSMLSKAFEISCRKMNRGLLAILASLIIDSKMCIGVWQEPPGSPAKLLPFRMLCWCSSLASLLVMILVMSFQAVSNNVIGLVFFK